MYGKYAFSSMQKAVNDHSDFQDVEFIWIDFTCVPQHNPSHQQLAINSLPQIVAQSNHFMILSGESQVLDKQNRDEASMDVYRSRGWCRLEYIAAFMTHKLQRWICNIPTGNVDKYDDVNTGEDLNPFLGNFQEF